jgi:hypothetical protein
MFFKRSQAEKLRRRISREKRTLRVMVEMYCNAKHGTEKGHLCESCTDVLNYAYKRIDRCVFKEMKPACNHCPIHCFKPDYKEKMREIMRYAGPRMTFRHPIMALRHVFDAWRGDRLTREWYAKRNLKYGTAVSTVKVGQVKV